MFALDCSGTPSWKCPVRFSHLFQKKKKLDRKRGRRREGSAGADDKQEEWDTVIYTARRRELGFDVYELDEPVLFFSSSFASFRLFNHFCGSVAASQLRQTPARRAERWSIFHESSSARQSECRWWRQRHKDTNKQTKSSRVQKLKSVPYTNSISWREQNREAWVWSAEAQDLLDFSCWCPL